jgi:hypothetical protein
MKQRQRSLAKVENLRQAGKALLPLAVLLLLASVALAQGSYDLSWWTMDGGGYTFSEGGSYTLGGTIGQPDAGVLASDDYTLVGGFWGGAAAREGEIYLPIIMRNYR